MDTVLTLWLLAELHRELNCSLHAAYIDIKVGLDSVNRSAFWIVLKRLGISDVLLNILHDLQTGTEYQTGKCVLVHGFCHISNVH